MTFNSFLKILHNNQFKLLFFILLIVYIFLYMPFGFEDGDMGSIMGISWSMYNGYFPHRDFVYIKPAMAPFFHSLPLYITEEYGYLINRAGYFLQVFTYSYLAANILIKTFKVQNNNLVYFIAILGAMLSIHNYAPMPWNTIDGLFFSSIGAYFLIGDNTKLYKIMLAAFFISLGVLCKQSFYFIPVFLSIYLVLIKKTRKLFIFIGFGIAFAGLYLLILYLNNALDDFIKQMFSFTSSSSLLKTGVKGYYVPFKVNIVLILLSIITILLLKKFTSKSISFTIISILIASIFVYLYLGENSYYTVKRSLMQILFVLCSTYALYKSFHEKKFYGVLLLLGFSWSASISNGFNTPIDFSVPIVFCIYIICYEKIDCRAPNWPKYNSIIIFFITFYIGYQTPYMDSKRNKLTYDMGEIFTQLTFIKSDKETYEKYKELKGITANKSNYTFLPSVTMGHYLTKSINPIGVDWVFNHHLADEIPNYISKIENENVTIFLENFEGHINNYEEESDLTMHVKNNWKLVKKHKYFREYKKK